MWSTVPGSRSHVVGQVHDHLHADRPVARVVALRAGRSAASSCRPTGPTGPSPTTVSAARTSMPGMKPASGLARACRRPGRAGGRRRPCRPRSAACATGVPGQICTGAGAHAPARRPTGMNWPDREHQPAVLVQERRDARQLAAPRARTAGARRSARITRPPARSAAERRLAPIGIEQVDDLLVARPARPSGSAAGRGPGRLARMPRAARHHARDAEADVVGALVAEHLRRHAGHRRRSRRAGVPSAFDELRARAW